MTQILPGKVYGLTGGIGSGKSTVAGLLQSHGFSHLDADAVTRELSAPGGAAYAAIQKRFGTAERDAVRKIVFADPQARRDLEQILHPLIQAESTRRLAALPRPAIYEAALLVEAGRAGDFDGLIVVEAPWEARKLRVIMRNGWSAEMAENVLRSQIDDSTRRRHATWVIENSGGLADLERNVEAWVRNL